MKIFRNVFLVLLGIILGATLLFIGYYAVVTRGVKLSRDKLLTESADIVVCDASGEAISTAENTARVNLDALPAHVTYAFIDTEDKKFFSHHGFDYPRIAKACIKNLSSGAFKQGASTISQQLIKNTHLSQEKTLKRKVQEWKLTRQLERKLSKTEILENYLSIIYFGHNCFGLNSASAFYFDKEPSALTLGEACVLAGLVKAPNHYSPFKAPENCQRRKHTVLQNMLRNGHITPQEAETAQKEALPTSPTRTGNVYGYIHRTFDELSEIVETHRLILGGKIQVKTYCDPAIQDFLDSLMATDTQTDKTLSVIDNDSRGFKAYVSTVDSIRRSPASLLKPLLVYAPAIEENLLSPATPILDEAIAYGGYAPQNYDNAYHGYVSARDSLAKSYNVPAVKLLNTLTVPKAVGYAQKLGLNVGSEDYSLALALGGMKNGFSSERIFSAYTVFANRGIYAPSRFIQSIWIDGKCVYTNTPPTNRVYGEDTAYLVADMLRTAVESGTAKKLRALPCPIYAKTGTAGTHTGNTDAYCVAFTQKDVLGVWLGNADRSTIPHTGGGTPCNFIYRMQTQLLEEYARQGINLQPLTKPDGAVFVDLDKYSYEQHREMVLADPLSPASHRFRALFKQSQLPTKQSEIFSTPTIATPSVQLTETGVRIRFHPQPLYRYTLLRYENETPVVIYDGEYIDSFLDETAEENRKYVYAVIPYYQKQAGKEVRLPTVSTHNHIFHQRQEREILEKNWWEE